MARLFNIQKTGLHFPAESRKRKGKNMKRILHMAAIAAVLPLCMSAPLWADSFYYCGSGGNSLITINTATGVATVIGSYGPGNNNALAGAFSPDGVFYIVTNTYSNPNNSYLATVDLTTGQATPYAPLPNSSIDMLQFSKSGTLYASEGSNLYQVNVSTGQLTNIGSFGVGMMMDFAINSQGVMYGVASGTSGPSSFYTINTSTGHATPLFNVGIPAIMGLAFDSNDNLFGTRYFLANTPFYSIDLANQTVNTLALTGLPFLHGGDIPLVPEPSTLLTLGSGLIIAIGICRVRRKS